MKKSLTLFLQVIVVLIGIGTLALILWEPHIEGRNAHATLYEIYFNDPFLVYAYTSSIAFFAVLYQAFKALGLVRENKTFSPATLKALRTIKYCAITLIALIVAPIVYLFVAQPGDDIAGGVAVGLFLIIISTIIATTATVLQRNVRKAVDANSKNNVTV